jgi:hypothetical protein
LQHLVVPEPQHAITFGLEEQSPLGFERQRAVMLAAVDFNDQSSLVACKIRDVGAERHLTAELISTDLAQAQHSPDPAFRVRHVPPQRAGTRPSAG